MNAQLIRGLSHYKVELEAIKRFLIKPKTTFQWMDWLRLTSPEKTKLTTKLSPYATPLDHPVHKAQLRYTNLRTALIEAGVIAATPNQNGTRTYEWVGPFPLEGS